MDNRTHSRMHLRDPQGLVTEQATLCAPLVSEYQCRMLTVEQILAAVGQKMEPGKNYRLTLLETDI